MSQSNPMPDLKSLPPFDLAVLGTGLLAFIVSFFPWFGVKVHGATVGGVDLSGFGTSATENAWHSYSVLALLLILLGTIVAAAAIFAKGSLPDLPIGARWIAAGLCSFGALLYLIRVFTLPHHHQSFTGFSATEGAQWGAYLLLIVVLANAAAAVISALSSEEQVPWQQMGSMGGGATAAPPMGSPPPAAPPMPPPPPPAEPSLGDDPLAPA